MNIEERIKELSRKITNRFYSNLEVTDENQFDGLEQFVFDSIFSICKEAIKKAKVGENIRWINKIGKDGWCIVDEKFVDRIKELESEKC